MLFICARRDKTAIKAVYRLTDEVPYLPVYCALFCPYLHKDKATKQATAFGLFGTAFLWNTAKPLFSSFAFLLCLAKLQVICNGITCNSRRAFSLQHVLFTYSLLTEPAPLALFDVNRLLYYKPAPFSILFQYVNFAVSYLFKTLQR